MRAQSAIEFLITYGWAFTIIAITLLALYSAGFFSPTTYAAQQCLLPSSFSCLSFFMSLNGLLTVNIQQATSSPINVTALGCNQNSTFTNMQKPLNPPSNQIFMSIGANYTFSVQCYTNAGSVAGNILSTYQGTLIVNYTNDITKFPGTALGKISTKLT